MDPRRGILSFFPVCFSAQLNSTMIRRILLPDYSTCFPLDAIGRCN